jgi:hypothetical protein
MAAINNNPDHRSLPVNNYHKITCIANKLAYLLHVHLVASGKTRTGTSVSDVRDEIVMRLRTMHKAMRSSVFLHGFTISKLEDIVAEKRNNLNLVYKDYKSDRQFFPIILSSPDSPIPKAKSSGP